MTGRPSDDATPTVDEHGRRGRVRRPPEVGHRRRPRGISPRRSLLPSSRSSSGIFAGSVRSGPPRSRPIGHWVTKSPQGRPLEPPSALAFHLAQPFQCVRPIPSFPGAHRRSRGKRAESLALDSHGSRKFSAIPALGPLRAGQHWPKTLSITPDYFDRITMQISSRQIK